MAPPFQLVAQNLAEPSALHERHLQLVSDFNAFGQGFAPHIPHPPQNQEQQNACQDEQHASELIGHRRTYIPPLKKLDIHATFVCIHGRHLQAHGSARWREQQL